MLCAGFVPRLQVAWIDSVIGRIAIWLTRYERSGKNFRIITLILIIDLALLSTRQHKPPLLSSLVAEGEGEGCRVVRGDSRRGELREKGGNDHFSTFFYFSLVGNEHEKKVYWFKSDILGSVEAGGFTFLRRPVAAKKH